MYRSAARCFVLSPLLAEQPSALFTACYSDAAQKTELFMSF